MNMTDIYTPDVVRLNTINAYTALITSNGYGTLAQCYNACCHDRELDAGAAKTAGEYLLANADEVWDTTIGPLFDEICEAGGLG